MLDTFDKLSHLLRDQAVVLTPNARLTLTLERRYNALQKQTVWPTPNIMPLSAWLKILWREAQSVSLKPLPPLLKEDEEAFIWRALIQTALPYSYALDSFTTQIKTAWTHCHQWCLDIDKKRFDYNEETQFFYTLTKAFQEQTASYQPLSTLIGMICDLIEEGLITPPKDLVLAYFDTHTPREKALIDLLKAKNVNIHLFDEEISDNDVSSSVFEDRQAETDSLIAWLDKALQKGKNNIGVVVPTLHQRREELERDLLLHFPKEQVNFSMGNPLSSFPIVSNALSLLHIKKGMLSLPEMHLLLFSPFIANTAEDRQTHNTCYQHLKNTGETQFYLAHLIARLKDTSIAQSLKQFSEIDIKGKKTLSDWYETFTALFKALGFPGSLTLSSEEYQTLNKFYDTLDYLKTMPADLKRMPYGEALNWLSWLLKKTLFQPKAKNEPVQVLGLLEALGLQFDALWVMGLTDSHFPGPTAPSPFIPLFLQQAEDMPHSSLKREYAYSEKALKRLTRSAPEVVLTAYLRSEDEHFSKSPLLTPYPLIDRTVPRSVSQPKLESYTPCFKLKPFKNITTKGGTFIIKEQAQCPFRAFARFRLGIREARSQTEGLDELARGILIHAVLEHFWKTVKTQSQLLSVSEEELEIIINAAVDKAISDLQKNHPVTFNAPFKQLEETRLKTLLAKWIALEKKRPPFEVTHIESKETLKLGPMTLSMRVDRIDTLKSGEKMVIDYKTGSPSLSNWFSERIDEPQLPLYSLTDKAIKTLAFGLLKSTDIKFKGISDEDCEIPGIKTVKAYKEESFDDLRDKWHDHLSLLAEDYLRGIITPSPLSESLCQQCDFKSLCGKLR